MNSDQFGRSLGSLTSKALGPGRSADEVASDLFLAVLTRQPTEKEKQLFREHAAKAGSTNAAASELAWALLMTSEFSLNH